MNQDQQRVKEVAYNAKTNLVDAACGQVQGATPFRPPTFCEEAEKNVNYHYEQAEKHSRAANFFRENPAFEEFIRLVRSGAIQFIAILALLAVAPALLAQQPAPTTPPDAPKMTEHQQDRLEVCLARASEIHTRHQALEAQENAAFVKEANDIIDAVKKVNPDFEWHQAQSPQDHTGWMHKPAPQQPVGPQQPTKPRPVPPPAPANPVQ